MTAASGADRVLLAACEGVSEPDGTPCTGLARYRWGQIEAPCDTCGGRCGIAVAAWLRVERADQPGRDVAAEIDALGVCPQEDCRCPRPAGARDCGNHESWMT